MIHYRIIINTDHLAAPWKEILPPTPIMSDIVIELISMPGGSEVHLFIYSWLASDYSTFDKKQIYSHANFHRNHPAW